MDRMAELAGKSIDQELVLNSSYTVLQLRNMQQAGKLCDLELCSSDGTSFSVHKSYLAAASEYFRGIFCGPTNMVENQSNKIKLQNVDATMLKLVVQSIYDDPEFQITKDTVVGILDAAARLQLPILVAKCAVFLAHEISNDGVANLLELCKTYDLSCYLRGYVHTHIAGRLDEYLSSDMPAVDQIDATDLAACVSFNKLACSQPSMMLDVVLKWLKVDPMTRTKYATKLLDTIQFPLMKPARLHRLTHFADEELSDIRTQMKRLAEEALVYQDQPMHHQVTIQSDKTTLRCDSDTNLKLVAITKKIGKMTANDMIYLEELETSTSWRRLIHEGQCVPEGLSDMISAVVINNFMMVCEIDTGKAYLFDPRFTKWEQIASLPERGSYMLASQGTTVLAIGGMSDLFPHLSTSVVKYSFDDNRWTVFATLPEGVSQPTICNYGAHILLSGGLRSPHNYLASDMFMKIDTVGSGVEQLGAMPRTYYKHGMIQTGNRVYVVPKTYSLSEDPVVMFDFTCQQWGTPQNQQDLVCSLPRSWQQVVRDDSNTDNMYYVGTMAEFGMIHRSVKRTNVQHIPVADTTNIPEKVCAIPVGTANMSACLLRLPVLDITIDDERVQFTCISLLTLIAASLIQLYHLSGC